MNVALLRGKVVPRLGWIGLLWCAWLSFPSANLIAGYCGKALFEWGSKVLPNGETVDFQAGTGFA
jgi:hypothetical protein